MAQQAFGVPSQVIHIICRHGETLADPPRVFAKGGDTVGIQSHCKGDAIVFFPNPLVIDNVDGQQPKDPDRGFTYNIASGAVCAVKLATVKRATVERATVKRATVEPKGIPEPGVYPFSLYCKEHGDFAIGNSPPEIIIEEGP
jgi:hypothetical protein